MSGALGPKLKLPNKPSWDCIGFGSLVVSWIRNLGHNIWRLVRDLRDLQDPIWRFSCVVSALNFFHLLCTYSLRALNYTFTCRNSNLYWVGIGLGGCAGGPSTGGLEETSLAPAWRTGSSSVRRKEVLICKEGRLPALRVTVSVLSPRPHWNVCLCYYVLVNCVHLSVLLCLC